MKFFALTLMGLMVAGCETSSTLPEGVSASDVATFKTAVIAAGCAVTFETADDVKADIGFEDDKLRAIVEYLTLAGESEPTDNGFRLTSGQCANA